MSLEFAPPLLDLDVRADGTKILRSPQNLEAYPDHLGLWLRRWATERPGGLFLAERLPKGDDTPRTDWREITWAQALASAEALGQGLLELGASSDKALMILSGNSVDHALLMLGAHLAAVPVAPVSPAYSLLSKDHAKLRYVAGKVKPALIFVDRLAPFIPALKALDLRDVTVVIGDGDLEALKTLDSRPSSALGLDQLSRVPGEALLRAEASVGPDSVAKYLFTSGSTDVPKGVLNTHRMLCSNQQMIAQVWPFVGRTPPVLLDWLPWNHTFGGNHNFNLVLAHGGSLYIDGGKPAPGLVEVTVENLRQVAPTLYFNVPAGFAQLLPFLERDKELRTSFFRRLQMIFYAGAALPQDLWHRLEVQSEAARGDKVTMVSAWGSTETSPAATTVHFPIDRAGVIGLPLPGVEIKMVPAGSKQELRVRGPHVFPSYLDEPELTSAAFDDEGFYKIGDAGRLADPDKPSQGLVFDGRVAEDFKLQSGTWVSSGRLRVEALAAAQPVLQDAVVAGHDRSWVGLLAWPNLAACRALLEQEGFTGAADLDIERIIVAEPIVERLRRGLRVHNEQAGGSSRRIQRVLLMIEPASIDAGEITDKGYINQRATLERRASLVDQLYSEPPGEPVIVVE